MTINDCIEIFEKGGNLFGLGLLINSRFSGLDKKCRNINLFQVSHVIVILEMDVQIFFYYLVIGRAPISLER